MSSYRDVLFQTYNATHAKALDGDEQARFAWFQQYAQVAYEPFLQPLVRAKTEILEIGCSKGFLLKALKSWGFEKLYGVDA